MGFGIAVNLDLLSVGVAVAAIGILGFAVFFANWRSITNRTFLAFSLLTIIWGISNYFNYQFGSPDLILWALRAHLFISVWHAFTFFQLASVFPKEKVDFTPRYKFILIPIVLLVSILTLTPLVFSGIGELAPSGAVTNPDRGPGIGAFALTALFLVVGGVVALFRKFRKAQDIEKRQLRFMLVGAFLTFLLIITFNLILPVFFSQLDAIPFGAVFVFPFVAFTAYAIFKHHLLNVKVIATEGAAFVLTIVSFFEVIISNDLNVLLFRSAVFVLVLVFSIFLIRSVLKEVEQREELERLNKQIEEKNIKLEELGHFKTQLLSIASHQVKSPLAAIKGFVSLIIEGSYGPVSAKIVETLTKVKKSTDDLVKLINTLLDLRKVEEGKMDYQFAPVDFTALVAGTVEELRPLAIEKKLDFQYTPPKEKVMVSADATKLKQVVQNLIDNAIKYTPNGYVVVGIRNEGKDVAFFVKDSGLGVAPELLPHLFEEFVREENIKTKILGTGLGLYIARRIVEAHNGKIWAESDGQGKGSRFCVELKAV